MIQDVDETLKELLVRKVPIDLTAVDIKFEMPTEEWASGVSKPTIDLFLYDVRENHELRSNQRYLARSGGCGHRAPRAGAGRYDVSHHGVGYRGERRAPVAR